ncbi:MAG: hypothetical protein QXG86_03985 [Candidatus Woesearchaeota archaeon]
MRLSNKVVEEVVRSVVGADVVPLVNLIKNKKNVSEFKIAESLGVTINIARNMLYRLYHKNLVSFVRKKDKKKGWYIYYWTFNVKNIKFLAENLKKERLEKLKERLEREKSSFFYVCPNECMRLDFDKATDYFFKCPECGSILQQENNSKKIEEIKKEIEKIAK